MSPKKFCRILIICLLIYGSETLHSQEIKPEKIYLLFKENDGKKDSALGKKFRNDKGLNFNLYQNYFIHEKNHSIDTLSNEKLCEFNLVREDELKEREKKWWKKNLKELKNKYKGVEIIPPFDRNGGVFDPYIIEKIGNRKIVIYQVDFRNEGVIN